MIVIGFFFGQTLQIVKRFGEHRIQSFGRLVGARILLFGGILFMIIGPAYSLGIADYFLIDFGMMMLLVMVALTIPVMYYTWKEVKRMPNTPLAETTCWFDTPTNEFMGFFLTLPHASEDTWAS